MFIFFKEKVYQNAAEPGSANPFKLSIEQYFNPRENPGKGFNLDSAFLICIDYSVFI